MKLIRVKDCETKKTIHLNPSCIESYRSLGNLDYNSEIFLITTISGNKIHVAEDELKRIKEVIQWFM